MKNKKKLFFSSVVAILIVSLLGFLLITRAFFNKQEYEIPKSINIMESDNNINNDDKIDIVPNVPDENTPSDEVDSSDDDYVPPQTDANNESSSKPSNSNTTKPNSSDNNTTKPNTSTNNNIDNNKVTTTPEPEKPANPVTTEPEPQKPMTLKEKVESMSIEEKIAQMLIISFDGTSMNSKTQSKLAYNPGGVILFANNVGTYNDTIKLVSDIKNSVSITPFVSIDQEGGRVQRIKDMAGITNIEPMWEIGKSNDSSKAYTVGKTIGNDLKKFGINMDFAPVLDIVESVDANVIGNRSFGSLADLVSKMGVALGRGLTESGVIPVYKHFPGHGSTITDSHYDLPVLTLTKEELLAKDLIPFKEAIKNNAKVIMIGHLAIPNITNDKTPASLSKTIITDLLKNELGYNGLVITDALNMKAITNNYTEKRIYEMAINAGVDLLLMPNSVESAINLIKQSIAEGTIKEQQINNSVTKILNLKHDYLGYVYK